MKEYHAIEENPNVFRLEKRTSWFGLKFKWKEVYGWHYFANDDGGWREQIRFKTEEAAEKYLENRGRKEVGNFVTTEYTDDTFVLIR